MSTDVQVGDPERWSERGSLHSKNREQKGKRDIWLVCEDEQISVETPWTKKKTAVFAWDETQGKDRNRV